MVMDWMLGTDAARVLGVSPDRVKQIANEGGLPALRVGRRGVRVYRRGDVERLAAERQAAKRAAAA
jgi:excisionase family DNA binding protein